MLTINIEKNFITGRIKNNKYLIDNRNNYKIDDLNDTLFSVGGIYNNEVCNHLLKSIDGTTWEQVIPNKIFTIRQNGFFTSHYLNKKVNILIYIGGYIDEYNYWQDGYYSLDEGINWIHFSIPFGITNGKLVSKEVSDNIVNINFKDGKQGYTISFSLKELISECIKNKVKG